MDLEKIRNAAFLNFAGNKVSSHQNDSRDHVSYCVDLILGWLAEDIILTVILLEGIPARLQGSDSEREFLSQNELDTAPDIIIGKEGEERLLEIICDWTNHWEEQHKADLRDNKFVRLVKDNSLLLGVSPISGTGFLMNVSDNHHEFEYNQYIGAYNKSGYTTKEINNHLKSINEVLSDLYNIFNEKTT